MKVTAKVIKGPGVKKQLRNKLQQYEEKLGVSVGIHSDVANTLHENPDGSHGPATVGEVAAYHEFGLGVPERSFIRVWYDENQARVKNDLRKVARGVVSGKWTLRQGMDKLGKEYVEQVQARILGNIPPALQPATIKRKGHNIALIDTEHLFDSISYELVRLAKR